MPRFARSGKIPIDPSARRLSAREVTAQSADKRLRQLLRGDDGWQTWRGSNTGQSEILEAALDAFEEGIIVLDAHSNVRFWNHAAATITGFQSAEMLSRKLPASAFYQVEAAGAGGRDVLTPDHPQPVQLHHHQGHALSAVLREVTLRDATGRRSGTMFRFHAVDEIDTLPHGAREGEGNLDRRLAQSQAAMDEALVEAWERWKQRGYPFGLIWIAIDQSPALRKSHGRDACEAMFEAVERTLHRALRPAELLSRWGLHEFLLLCHEPNADLLEIHAQHLKQTAESTEFLWWGDPVPVTVTVGAAQAAEEESLGETLARAQNRIDGNRNARLSKPSAADPADSVIPITGRRGQSCSQS